MSDRYIERHEVRLSDYQVANLVESLRAILGSMYGGVASPLNAMNTGDWVGELYWKLEGITKAHPNRTAEEMAQSSINQGKRMP